MKKVSLIFAMFLGFAATTYAQIGQGDCAWNAQYVQPNEKKEVMSFYDIVPLGISNSEGEPVYSVALTANFTTLKASNVIVTETKTGKKWLMSLISPLNSGFPAPCAKSNLSTQDTRIHRSNATNLIVYVTIPFNTPGAVFVHLYKPAGPQNFKINP